MSALEGWKKISPVGNAILKGVFLFGGLLFKGEM